jgi:nitrogenase-stabilizing/protective protein
MIDPVGVPELAGLSEAEEFFEALGVPYDPRVLDAHRLHVMKAFGLAFASWLSVNPGTDAGARRTAAARALREAYGVFAEAARAPERRNPFAPGLVQLGRPRRLAG